LPGLRSRTFKALSRRAARTLGSGTGGGGILVIVQVQGLAHPTPIVASNSFASFRAWAFHSQVVCRRLSEVCGMCLINFCMRHKGGNLEEGGSHKRSPPRRNNLENQASSKRKLSTVTPIGTRSDSILYRQTECGKQASLCLHVCRLQVVNLTNTAFW
jgi:hypothetical protein